MGNFFELYLKTKNSTKLPKDSGIDDRELSFKYKPLRRCKLPIVAGTLFSLCLVTNNSSKLDSESINSGISSNTSKRSNISVIIR